MPMKNDWPDSVSGIYDKYVSSVGGMAMDYGPAHIVWADGNFSDSDIQFCMDACGPPMEYDLSPAVIAEVRASLIELLAIPESERTK